MTLAILWHRLYVHHRLATVDILSTRNPSLAALVLRDGTVQLTAILLLDLVATVMNFLDVDAAAVVVYRLTPVLVSRVLLNVRAAARSTRGEQSETPSFVRSKHELEAQGDVENMSFELNILNSTEQAQDTDRAHPRDSLKHDEMIAEPRSIADDVAAVGDAHQDVGEAEATDEIEEEMVPDGENDA
ncbi:uncharacterized protein LAESUDRAFT_814454 [Laetiporus sulphureus 93-53]|uniref:Uncharacterized protein n=1 Tax=Laetiporus sulphureus 93-53 TaxID=1314785 RepID=A0A165CZE6_9APHY|nr:uncharacterized protein LAESUDRAFT_814454 [Laetiporus sulphureus 93-53]KZT03807.1 hypothetical protein LAESUDRAFT_814454 [Laetiporus sulphureus 93-53]